MKLIQSAATAAVLVVATFAATTATSTATSTTTAGGPPGSLVCDNTEADPATGTYTSVRVPRGASCYLDGATVTGNLKAFGARNVYVINTAVENNILIRGTRRDVVIGPEGCRFDPPVGNNIHVSRSHNVAICFMTADNNIMVTRNDGRLMLKKNVAGNSIKVNNNLPYVAKPGDGQHANIDAIRIRRNEAARHIDVRRNGDRPLFLVDNTPEPRT